MFMFVFALLSHDPIKHHSIILQSISYRVIITFVWILFIMFFVIRIFHYPDHQVSHWYQKFYYTSGNSSINNSKIEKLTFVLSIFCVWFNIFKKIHFKCEIIFLLQPLRRALARMCSPQSNLPQLLVPDSCDNSLSYSVLNHLKRLKNQAKIEYDR